MTDGKRKACKNCVCGRAEEEAAEEARVVKLTADDAMGAVIGSKEIKSSCGSVGCWSVLDCVMNSFCADFAMYFSATLEMLSAAALARTLACQHLSPAKRFS